LCINKEREIIKIPGKAGAYGSENNIQTGSTIFSAFKIIRYLYFDLSAEIQILSPNFVP